MQVSNVLIKPVITEKSMSALGADEYTFKVNVKASKGAISREVRELYGVDVKGVRTMIVSGKKRRIPKTRRFIKTKKWKKAIVKLKKGQKIDLFTESAK